MKKKGTEFPTEEGAQATLRVPDRRTLQGKRDYVTLKNLFRFEMEFIHPA